MILQKIRFTKKKNVVSLDDKLPRQNLKPVLKTMSHPFNLTDDFSWLVYADWLEERGESYKANKIRMQITCKNISWNYEFYVVGFGSVDVGVGGVGGVGVGGVGVGGGGVGDGGGGGVGVGGVGVGGGCGSVGGGGVGSVGGGVGGI
jgi:uncharacterized protein (TIGR02996 family)